MLRLRHAMRLAVDAGSYARMNRSWWILPALLVLAIVVALSTATQAAVPYAVYTLF